MSSKVTKSLWQFYARVYDAVLLRFLPYRELIAHVTSTLDAREGWTILDAGCGTGNFIYHIIQACPEVKAAGVDFSPAMLTRAMLKIRKAAPAGISSVIFREADLNSPLPFTDEEFAGAICVNVLYAVDNPEFLLGEINRVLQKNGRLILVTPPVQPQMWPIFRAHACRLKEVSPAGWVFLLAGQVVRLIPFLTVFLLINILIKDRRSFHFFTSEELSLLVKSCGFKVVSIVPVYGGQDWLVEAKKTASRDALKVG
jgi:ubiquinone/menaquinone biosynthesis C-methylase UbiE